MEARKMKEAKTLPNKEYRLQVAALSGRKPIRFSIAPSPAICRQIAEDLDLKALRKLRFAGEIQAEGDENWRLDATLGATVVQPCVVTLQPVTTRIDEKISRRFLAQMPDDPPEGDPGKKPVSGEGTYEVEMPEDETIEALQPEIDLWAIMLESLALSLPLYPKAEDAVLEKSRFAPPDARIMTDEETRPFAGLAALRDKLSKKQ